MSAQTTSSAQGTETSTRVRRPWFIVVTNGPDRHEQDKAFRKGEEVIFSGRFSESPNYFVAGDEEVTFSARIKMFYPDPPAGSKSIWNVARRKSAIIADIGERVVTLTLHYDPATGTGHAELPLNW